MQWSLSSQTTSVNNKYILKLATNPQLYENSKQANISLASFTSSPF